MKKKGNLIVISAPSGAGKSTICDEILKRNRMLVRSVSVTTRPKRKGEKNAVDYFFTDEAGFKTLIKEKALLEWAFVHGCYYGTPKKFIMSKSAQGIDILLNIDVQGGVAVKKAFPDAVLIFVMTTSMKVLEYRLRKRNLDSGKVIAERLANARQEIKYMPKYDYLVINDRLDHAVNEVENIIRASKHKITK